jgi:dienelactone hydrolase
MNRRFEWGLTLAAMLLALLTPGFVAAQEEIPPPSGRAPVVVVFSGATGSGNYRAISTRIAALGYDVVLFDSNTVIGGRKDAALAQSVRAAIAQARQMPHALPGKVAVMGFSLGGGLALGFGSMWSDDVAVVAAWYPSTSGFKDPKAFASRIRVPVVMFAGTADEYKFCCMIDKARDIAAAAKAANAPFELTIYPGARHGFTIQGADYSAPATEDAFARTAAALRLYLGG